MIKSNCLLVNSILAYQFLTKSPACQWINPNKMIFAAKKSTCLLILAAETWLNHNVWLLKSLFSLVKSWLKSSKCHGESGKLVPLIHPKSNPLIYVFPRFIGKNPCELHGFCCLHLTSPVKSMVNPSLPGCLQPGRRRRGSAAAGGAHPAAAAAAQDAGPPQPLGPILRR